MFVIFFFFFQAEDGIRDIGVTGVQTCALPILKASKKLRLQKSNTQEQSMIKLLTSKVPSLSSAWLLRVLQTSHPILEIYFQNNNTGFRNKWFLLGGVVSPTPNPQPGGPGAEFCLASIPKTNSTWLNLPEAKPPSI